MTTTMNGTSDSSLRRRAAYSKGRRDLAMQILVLMQQNKLVLPLLRAELGFPIECQPISD
jgi:hypothetical protein